MGENDLLFLNQSFCFLLIFLVQSVMIAALFCYCYRGCFMKNSLSTLRFLCYSAILIEILFKWKKKTVRILAFSTKNYRMFG